MFQFEYLNRQKISSPAEFMDRLEAFLETVDNPYPCSIEIRNPNYLNKSYFEMLMRLKYICSCSPAGLLYAPDKRCI